eukprot:2482063-Amphidinium_carterae.1
MGEHAPVATLPAMSMMERIYCRTPVLYPHNVVGLHAIVEVRTMICCSDCGMPDDLVIVLLTSLCFLALRQEDAMLGVTVD